MSACETLAQTAALGVAPALRAVDCIANEVAAGAFGRLFGGSGALMPALTIILTLYIAFFAVSLLTGRSRIGISAMTPRMLTLGLVLTFVTSWVAYQSVVWNLAVGAPDQIAGVLMGAKGSATDLFAQRIDVVFAAIADAAASVTSNPQAAAAQGAAGSFAPSNLMWLAALLLLLGTVGVLVTARIALAVLLVLGPVFIVLALFNGTRGLFAGWVRGVVLTALAPLFAVLGGGFMIELVIPVIAGLDGTQGIDGRAALALFLIAAVHVALMVMVLRVAGTMVAGWSVFGLANGAAKAGRNDQTSVARTVYPAFSDASFTPTPEFKHLGRTGSSIAAPAAVQMLELPSSSMNGTYSNGTRIVAAQIPATNTSSLPPLPNQRARGVGSRFATPAKFSREMYR